MSKNKKIILISLTLIILSLTIFLLTNKKEKSEVSKEEYIKEVLETEDYSYLPEPAKEYITSKYNETGEIIKTEKNKEEGEPYLNPRYVEYISNIDRNIVNSSAISENGENIINNYDLIPKETIIDYYEGSIATTYNNEELPSSYDLRNVDGKNYVTPIKDQGNLGICWSFATNAQLESYLLKKNNQTYTSDAVIFSERQMDYGLSINGIKEYFNDKYGTRLLGDGGNFKKIIDLGKEGLSFVTQRDWENIYKNYFNKDYVYNDLSEMELKDTLNYDNSLYEVNSAIEMPYLNTGSYDVTSQEYLNLRESYLNTVKTYIMEYGGAYVGTGAPGDGCSIYDVDINNYIIYDNDKCNLGSHAMQIIGWDDSIEYEFCAADGVNTKTHSNDLTSCSEDRKVNRKGVWILKNSWGETKSYTYLAYDSLYTDINFITDVSLTKDRLWDYSESYKIHRVHGSNFSVDSNNYRIYYTLIDINNISNVGLEKVKFYSTNSDTKYSLFIAKKFKQENEEFKKIEFEYIDTVDIEAPGLYTFDLSHKNININDDYIVGISELKENHFTGFFSDITYYYSHLDNNVTIKTYDASYKNVKETKIGDNYKLHVHSESSNISSSNEIHYELYDLVGNNISNNLSYKYNIATNNEINALLTISNSVKPGQYILKTIYDNEVKCESKLYLSEIKQIKGTGAENDPYIITTPDELYMINDDMGAYYELGNDIDLIFDTSNPGGKFYNKGMGWIPIGTYNKKYFYGNLDGKQHKIIGLTMSKSNFSGGLFKQISPTLEKRNISVQNIIFKDINIDMALSEVPVYTYTSVLSGEITDGYQVGNGGRYYIEDDVNINISNIAILDSKIAGVYSSASLVGRVQTSKEKSILINNIFSNSLVYKNVPSSGTYVGGIVGQAYIQNDFEPNASIKIKNIENIGSLSTYGDGNYCGGIVGYVQGKLELENVINNSISKFSHPNYITYGALIGNYNSMGDFNGKSVLKNIYYTQDENMIGSINSEFTESNVYKKDVFDLKNESLYTSWDSETEKFSDNWKIETIDGIKRIPILKFVDFEYIKVADINNLYEEYISNIYDYMTPKNDIIKDRTKFKIQDESIATIDENGNIEGLKVGETILHIESEYDGYINDVKLNVKEFQYLLTFNSNYGEEKTYIQKFADEPKKLKPNEFKKVGYKLKEWNTKRDGTGVSYSDEQLVNITDSLTLYAIWEPIKYIVRYIFYEEFVDVEFTYDVPQKLIVNPFKYEGHIFIGWSYRKEDGTHLDFIDGEEVVNLTDKEEIIMISPVWQRMEGVVIIEYAYDLENNFITEIQPNTNITKYKEILKKSDSYILKIYDRDGNELTDESLIFTGSITKILNGDFVVSEYTNIVRGDINGDGLVTSADVSKIYSYIRNTINIEEKYYLEAADVNNDKNNTTVDVSKIYSFVRKVMSLL